MIYEYFSLPSFEIIDFFRWLVDEALPEAGRIQSLVTEEADRRPDGKLVAALCKDENPSLLYTGTAQMRQMFR